MNEHDLSVGLRSTAEQVSAHPDLAEVELGAGRVRSRRRVATGVVAAMLVAGAGGTGFGIGRAVSGDDGGEISAAVDTPPATSVAADPVDEPIDPPADPVGSTVAPAADDRATGAADAADVVAAGGLESSLYVPAEMDLVYERVLDNGVRVRVQRGQSWAEFENWPEGEWRPAPFCYGSAEMRITVDGTDVVDVSGGAFYDQLFDGVQFEITGVGWADGHDMRLVTVQAEPGVTEATVSWSDGPTDTAPLVDGLAVLVVDGSDPFETEYILDIVGGDGTRTLGPADLNRSNDAAWRAACQEPPPALPGAGEQPADPAAAQDSLTARFDLLWNTDVPQTDKTDLLDDWTGVQDAVDATYAGDFGETARTATHVIEELVFTSPTSAWFRYIIQTDVTTFSDRYGTAELVDGGWQFPRALMCQDLGLAGAGCEPSVDNIFPPSWYERYGDIEGGDHEIICQVDQDGTEVCEGPLVGIPTTTPPGD